MDISRVQAVKINELPKREQTKLMKKYEFLVKKHPGLPETSIQEKLNKKRNPKINFDDD